MKILITKDIIWFDDDRIQNSLKDSFANEVKMNQKRF